MRMRDILPYDRSLNGNHTPACALPTRGGVCDCWPPATDSSPWGPTGQTGAAGPAGDTVPGLSAGSVS